MIVNLLFRCPIFHSFFKAFGYFEAVYLNFTNWNLLSACIQYIIDTTPNQRIFKTMFDGVTCRDSISNSTIIRSIHVKMYDTHEYCNHDSMDVFNVSTSGAGHVEQFCGKSFLAIILSL